MTSDIERFAELLIKHYAFGDPLPRTVAMALEEFRGLPAAVEAQHCDYCEDGFQIKKRGDRCPKCTLSYEDKMRAAPPAPGARPSEPAGMVKEPPEPVARLMRWKGPSHLRQDVRLVARTFEEFPTSEAKKPNAYWADDEPLVLLSDWLSQAQRADRLERERDDYHREARQWKDQALADRDRATAAESALSAAEAKARGECVAALEKVLANKCSPQQASVLYSGIARIKALGSLIEQEKKS